MHGRYGWYGLVVLCGQLGLDLLKVCCEILNLLDDPQLLVPQC